MLMKGAADAAVALVALLLLAGCGVSPQDQPVPLRPAQTAEPSASPSTAP